MKSKIKHPCSNGKPELNTHPPRNHFWTLFYYYLFKIDIFTLLGRVNQNEKISFSNKKSINLVSIFDNPFITNKIVPIFYGGLILVK